MKRTGNKQYESVWLADDDGNVILEARNLRILAIKAGKSWSYLRHVSSEGTKVTVKPYGKLTLHKRPWPDM